MKQKDVVKLLLACGFEEASRPGNPHLQFKKDGIADLVTVPGSHNVKEIPVGTLSEIARRSQLQEEFKAVQNGKKIKSLAKEWRQGQAQSAPDTQQQLAHAGGGSGPFAHRSNG